MSTKPCVLGALLLLGGCVQPYVGPTAGFVTQQPGLATQGQTAGIEEQDRVDRFWRLAETRGIEQPQVEQILLRPGQYRSFAWYFPNGRFSHLILRHHSLALGAFSI